MFRRRGDRSGLLDPFPGVLRAEVAAGLGLSGRSSRRWYRRLEAGIARNEQPRVWANTPGDEGTALALVAPHDRQRVAEVVRDGSGLLIVSAHAGPRFVLLELLTTLRPDLLSVTANPEHWTDDECLSVVEGRATADDVLRMQFLGLYAGLRSGGVGYVAPDGGRGGGGLPVDMLGTTVTVGRAAAVLARRTGCACVPMVAAWQGDRVGVDIAAPIAPAPSEESDRWEQVWVEQYATWLESVYRADAMQWRLPTGLTLGFFEPSRELTDWHHAYNRMVRSTRGETGP